MNKARTSFHAVQWVVIIAVAAGLGLGIQTAHSQVFSYDRLVYDGTGGNTTGFQCNTRPHRGEPFSWGGKDYLLAHVGTDVQVFKLDEPGGSPVTRAKIGAGYDCSGFFDDNPPYIPFGPPVEIEWLEGHGESSNADGIAVKTHTLANDGIKGAVTCDECRYAVVDANNHSVVVDLSAPTSNGEPEVIGKWIIEDDFKVTYRVGSTQYLMGVRSSGCGNNVGVWKITPGETSPTVSWQTCLDSSFPVPGAGEVAHGGSSSTAAGAFVIFRADAGDNQVYLADVSGAIPQIVGSSIQSRGNDVVAVDLDEYPNGDGYLLVVDLQGSPSIHRVRAVGGKPTVSKLSGLNFPGASWGIGSLTVGSNGDGFVYLSTAEPPLSTTRGLFQLSNLDLTSRSAVEIDHAYWNDTQSDFNQAPIKPIVGKDLGATFDRDGDGLFLFRYYALIHMKYDGPAEPTPGVDIDNIGIIYPGTLVELTNASSNWDTAKGWVTTGSSPDDFVVHSSGAFSPSLTSFDWATDPAFDCTVDYWVHVQINGETGPIASEMIPFECSPQVDLIAPSNALTNSEPTLTADAPGFEHNSSDYDYTWDIWYPETQTNDPPDATIIGGDEISPLLDTAGLWNFKLTVAYDHWNEWNGPDPVYYEDSSPIRTIDVSGLAPDIGFSPASPTIDTGITLDAGDSEAVEDLTGGTYTYLVDDVPVTGCSGALTWNQQGQVQIPDCVVPESFINADTQQVGALTLSADQEIDKTATTTFTVRSYNFGFTFAPSSPNRGETVVFTLTQGSPSDIHRWEFGNQSSGDGEDCNGLRDYVCNGSSMYCDNVPWSFKNSGPHEVRIYDLNNAEVASATITVGSSGSCPSAACTSYSLNPVRNWDVEENGGNYSVAVTGNPSGCEPGWTASVSLNWVRITNTTASRVYYTVDPFSVPDGSRNGYMSIGGKSFEILQVGPPGGGPTDFDFTISDSTPDKGQEVTFNLTQGSPSDVHRWEFGSQSSGDGESCDGFKDFVCNGSPLFCKTVVWSFKKSGTHQVRVLNSSNEVLAQKNVTVSTNGSCSGEPEPDPCEFTATMTPADGIFSHIGGDGQINVTASEPECSWNVTVHWSYQHWVFLGSPSGRDGSGNMTFEIASHDEELPRDAVLSVNGDDGFSRVFNITQTGKPKPAKFSVASVARTKGQGGSNWSTQLRLTNPEDHVLPVLVRFVRLDLTQEDLITEVSIPNFPLQPHVTYFVEDIVSAIAGNLEGEDVKGALQIEVQDEVEGQPVITSRTATKAAEGSYGQFIPAVPMIHTDVQEVVLVGLADNDEYRTNIGVTNLENRIVNVDLVAIDSEGNTIGEKRVGVPRLANNQLGVRDLFPDFVDSDNFSVKANTGDADVTVYGQMMHKVTSDPMYIGSDQTVSKVQVIPNLAHIRGLNFSSWRSDVAIYNPNPVSINLHMTYVPDPADGFWWPSKQIVVKLEAYETRVLQDVVREFLTNEDDESKGYMIVESNESELAPPIIVGRTYTIDGDKIYGQGLSVVGEQNLLSEGDVAWFAGVEDSAEVRTNFSILNTGSGTARIELRFYDEHGIVRAGAKTLTFPEKDEFLQFDLFKALPELEPGSMRGSLQILVREGESVFPYVTIMDNLSNDPMFVTPTVME